MISSKLRYCSMAFSLVSYSRRRVLARDQLLSHLQHLFGRLFQYQRLRHRNTALTGRARFQPIDPRFQIGEALNVDAAPLVDAHPAPVSDIGDAVFVAKEFAALKLTFEHFEEPAAFVVITLDRRWELFGKIAIEDVGLPHHRSDARHLEHQPLRHPRLALFILGQQLAGLTSEVQQDGASLKYDEVVIGTVNDRRDAAVGTDSQELGLFLIAFAQVDLMDVVRQPYLFEEYGHFPAIRR